MLAITKSTRCSDCYTSLPYDFNYICDDCGNALCDDCYKNKYCKECWDLRLINSI